MSVATLQSGAIIRRVDRPADHFAMVSNGFARDMRLSFFARGVGLWLMSHADGFETTTTSLARRAGIGRDQVRRALVELEHHRYLRRERIRTESGAFGAMLYLVRCVPFPPDPKEDNPSSDLRLTDQAQADRAPVDAHHKKTSPKDNNTQKKIPSGGSLRESAEPAKESPMAKRVQAEALDLDFKDSQEAQMISGRQCGKATAQRGAQAVVAAFVDAYRQYHDGADPAKSSRGRVARDAAQLLAGGTKEDDLVRAATAMGATPYSNLPVQLSMLRQRGGPSKGIAPIAPPGSFDAAAAERHAQFLDEVRTDPQAAAWVARDPNEVAKLIAEDPSLEPVFARLATA